MDIYTATSLHRVYRKGPNKDNHHRYQFSQGCKPVDRIVIRRHLQRAYIHFSESLVNVIFLYRLF